MSIPLYSVSFRRPKAAVSRCRLKISTFFSTGVVLCTLLRLGCEWPFRRHTGIPYFQVVSIFLGNDQSYLTQNTQTENDKINTEILIIAKCKTKHTSTCKHRQTSKALGKACQCVKRDRTKSVDTVFIDESRFGQTFFELAALIDLIATVSNNSSGLKLEKNEFELFSVLHQSFVIIRTRRNIYIFRKFEAWNHFAYAFLDQLHGVVVRFQHAFFLITVVLTNKESRWQWDRCDQTDLALHIGF
ncbi:hypothetical protein Tsp_07845 [Trichinella spiralis]|uniref:hypothetical protein n=1 Tax=Trichinella spiralis TaxID=6334 RepID=UPI0001EFD00E|nr:hypothetical protein Tsp_07845 [Trichinella spiralis]